MNGPDIGFLFEIGHPEFVVGALDVKFYTDEAHPLLLELLDLALKLGLLIEELLLLFKLSHLLGFLLLGECHRCL